MFPIPIASLTTIGMGGSTRSYNSEERLLEAGIENFFILFKIQGTTIRSTPWLGEIYLIPITKRDSL